VKEKLLSFHTKGSGGYVLKDKLKLIKGSLKEWHQTHTSNLQSKISKVKDRISSLVVKSEKVESLEEELMELHSLSAEIL